MSLSREELTGYAHAERARLGRLVQYALPESWERMSAAAGWWNRDVVAHLAAQDGAAAQVVAGETSREFADYDGWRAGEGDSAHFTVDGFNDFAVGRRVDLPTRQVLEEWGRNADRFLRNVAGLTDEAWATRRVPWLAGDIAVRYLVQSRIVEWWVHGEDMRPAAELAPGLEHWPIHLTNDLAIRMLPWALSRAGLAFPEASVRIDLEGAGGGTWHWGLLGAEAAPEDKKADAFIEGRAYPFALVAARRARADEYLEDGNLVLGGEEEIAFAVLEHIRAYV